jgi:hypothetical protein
VRRLGALEISSDPDLATFVAPHGDRCPCKELLLANSEAIELAVEEISRVFKPYEWLEGDTSTFLARESSQMSLGESTAPTVIEYRIVAMLVRVK